jgi:hypothetical protein
MSDEISAEELEALHAAAEGVARSVDGYVQTACGELGYEVAADGEAFDENLDRQLRRLKRQGVRDIGGALADYLYSDPQTVEDLAGERLYEVMGQSGLDPQVKAHWNACADAFKKCVPHVSDDLDLGFIEIGLPS